METRYKFLRLTEKGKIKSSSGNVTWNIGKQKTFRGNLDMCEAGFHCSKGIYQAFSYVQGEVLAIVECDGKYIDQEDKEVWQKMKIVKAYKWQDKDSVSLSIYAAELVIANYENVYPNDSRPRDAIEAAKKWLKDPSEKNKEAAWSAWSAAWSAAGSAARSAAWSAWSAAWSAARTAAGSAAGSAAWSAAGSAARSAARTAAWSAGSAARTAAGSAAGSAAWSAARTELITKISTWMDKRISILEEIKV